ncbi:hypothetical protein COU12_00300, partial [Candidatus Jorgensenbacteria bacterium CG10_big_fil_rev_8_21_14_0_10_54_38]
MATIKLRPCPLELTFPIWWTILKIVRTHFAPTLCRSEDLAKNSACPSEVLRQAQDEGGNRNPELKNCQRTPIVQPAVDYG